MPDSRAMTIFTTPVHTLCSAPSIPLSADTVGTTVSEIASNSIVNTTLASGLSEETRERLRKLLGGTLEQFRMTKNGKTTTFYGVKEESAASSKPSHVNEKNIYMRFEILKVVMSAKGKSRPGGAEHGDEWHQILSKVGIARNRTVLAYVHLNAARLILEAQGYYKGSDARGSTEPLLSLRFTGQNTHGRTPEAIWIIETDWDPRLNTWENLWGRFDKHRALLVTGLAAPRRPRGERSSTVSSKDFKRKRAAIEADTDETGTGDSAVWARTAGTGSCKRTFPSGRFSYAKPSSSALSANTGSDFALASVPSLSSIIVSNLEEETGSNLAKFEDRGRIYYGVDESDARLLQGKECSKARIIARGSILRCLLRAKGITFPLYNDVIFFSDAAWDARLPVYSPKAEHAKARSLFQYFQRNAARIILALQEYYKDIDIVENQIHQLRCNSGGKAVDMDVADIENRYDMSKTPLENLWQRHREFYRKLIDPKSRSQLALPKRVKKTATEAKKDSIVSRRSRLDSELASSSGAESNDDEHVIQYRKPPTRASKQMAVSTSTNATTEQTRGRATSILKSLFNGVTKNEFPMFDIQVFLRAKLLPYLRKHSPKNEAAQDADFNTILGFLAMVRRGGLFCIPTDVTEIEVAPYEGEGYEFRIHGPDDYAMDTIDWQTVKEQMETAAVELLQMQSEGWLSK
jgi:hypothetical protein